MDELEVREMKDKFQKERAIYFGAGIFLGIFLSGVYLYMTGV